MYLKILITLGLVLLLPMTALAGDSRIKSAESAGPYSLAKNATIKDWNMKVIRNGTNGWTCFPDNPNTPGTDPWCMNKPWLNFLDAYVNQKGKPTYTGVGIAYMLQGDSPVSNTDPFATERKPGDDWVEDLGAHLMVLVPDMKGLENLPTNSQQGGPWIMWSGTPLAHLMIQIDSYPAK